MDTWHKATIACLEALRRGERSLPVSAKTYDALVFERFKMNECMSAQFSTSWEKHEKRQNDLIGADFLIGFAGVDIYQARDGEKAII